MAPPDAITTTNMENEIRALRPTVIIPVDEHVESEDEISVNRNEGEEIPPEGEPLDTEPEEAPLIEETDEATEEDEEVSDSSVAPTTTPTTIPLTPHVEHNNPQLVLPVPSTEPPSTFHMGESSNRVIRPRQDDPYTRFIPRQRINSPERVPHYITPARYSLSGDPYAPPTIPTAPQYNPDYNLQIHRELQTIRNQQRDLHERQVFLEEISVIESERTRLRMDGFEIELMRLRSIVRSLSARLNRLEDANLGRRM